MKSALLKEECLSWMKRDIFLFKRLINLIEEIDFSTRTLQKEWFHTGRRLWFPAMRTHCNTLQHAATRCNTLQQIKSCPRIHVAWCYCWGYFHKACSFKMTTELTFQDFDQDCGLLLLWEHCNTLQHAATHCNTLRSSLWVDASVRTLQHTATCYSTLRWIFGLGSCGLHAPQTLQIP